MKYVMFNDVKNVKLTLSYEEQCVSESAVVRISIPRRGFHAHIALKLPL